MSKNIKTIEMWAFSYSANLETVVFPKDCAIESIDKGCFNECTSLSNINLENCTSLKTLGDAAFSGCTAIDKLTLPNSLESIGFQALYNLGELELASDYLPKSLKTVDQYFLSSCKLKNSVLYFPQGFTSFNSRYCFAGSFVPETSLTLVFLGKMTDVNLSDASLTTFLNNGAQKPIKLVFAQNKFSDLSGAVVPTVDYNGQKGFVAISKDGSSLYTNQEGTLTVSFENANYYNLTGLGSDANGNAIYLASGSPTEIIFCGGDNVEISYTIRCNHTDKGWYRFHTTSEVYDLNTHGTQGVHYNDRVYQNGNCGYDEIITNTCVICKLQSVVIGQKATGEHTYVDDFNCETALSCDVCLKVLKEALTHNIKTAILYEEGYAAEGLKTIACQNEGCKHSNNEEKAEALFTCLGYSALLTGDGGIALGFSVNNEAINEYSKVTGKTIKYGVFAVSQNKLGSNNIFASDGGVADGVISAELTSYSFATFDVKVTGFTDEHKDKLLTMGAYVLAANENTTEYSYLQSNEKSEKIGNYYFTTYSNWQS